MRLPILDGNELLDDIVGYLGVLNREYRVSVHGVEQVLGPYFQRLLPYNTHTHPACLYAKACGLRLCNRCQRVAVAYARQRGECFGACYFGMAEYVFPIPLNRERTQCGIVSVSGYPAQAQTALARANHAAKRLPIDRDKLLSLLPAQSTAIPPLEELRPRIRPLADMLAFLAQSVPQGDFRDLPGGRARDVFYQRVVAYLEDHYRTNLSLETLAKTNHCSASYLSHMFKAKSGLSLRAYINALRIRDAAVYLENTDMPVSEIAYALGYGDSNYFSTVFQREKGCPPSAYRKRRGEQPPDQA